MLNLIRRLVADRRKKKEPVVAERRQRVATAVRAADQQLYDSIERFCAAAERVKSQMAK